MVRTELRSGLELAGLVGFAVVQPILGPLGESPETFAAAEAGRRHIVIFALAVALLPILGLWLLGAVTRVFGPGVRTTVQTVLVGGLAALGGVALARHVELGVAGRGVAAVVVGSVVAGLHRRWEPGRMFLRYASPLPVLLVMAFLFASPVATLVRPPAVEIDPAAAGDHPPVVYIVLDELPTLSLVDGQGGIDEDLFPNLARLADTSTWYRNHTSVATYTQSSLPAMLTGTMRAAVDRESATHGSHPDNLLTLLARTHEVHGAEWATQMCPPELCPASTGEIDPVDTRLLAAPLDERSSPLDSVLGTARSLWWSQVWPTAPDFDAAFMIEGMTEAEDLTRVPLEFLSGIEEQTDRPVLDYLHAPVPHIPWTLLPSGASHDGPQRPWGAEMFFYWPPGDLGRQLGAVSRIPHLLQLQWTDRFLGALIGRLEQVDRWDDSVIVVTSDHGASFEPDEHMRVIDPGNQVDLAWTPLFIKAPGQAEGSVVDDDVNALDVLPTIADLVGIEVGWEHDGVSLVEGAPADRPKPMLARDDRHKFGRSENFRTFLDDEVVELDADGLGAITSAPGVGQPSDPLRVWRHGRHGDLLGQAVEELGVCDRRGPGADIDASPSWDEYQTGNLDPGDPLPLWHEGSLDADGSRDVAAAVDGTVAGWSVSIPGHRMTEENRFGVLLAEPLVSDAGGAPAFYEIVDDPGCRLRPL
jgi:hypothetical protein